MSLKDDLTKEEVINLARTGYNKQEISNIIGIPRKTISDFLNRKSYKEFWEEQDEKDVFLDKKDSPLDYKALIIDIETSPMLVWSYGLFNQNHSIDMIYEDWKILSYSAKWLGSNEVIYSDTSPSSMKTELELLHELWELFDEADIVIGQNSNRFDIKKIRAKMFEYNMKPYSSFRKIDTLLIAKREFAFSSNKLDYTTTKFNEKHKKLKHEKYSGFLLFKECSIGNPEAWREMQEYNIMDVLSTEELYLKMRPWSTNHPNMAIYANRMVCSCGSEDFEFSGYHYTNSSKFSKFRCKECGSEKRDTVNLLPRNELGRNVV